MRSLVHTSQRALVMDMQAGLSAERAQLAALRGRVDEAIRLGQEV
jgi:hypothetical protein